MHGLPILPACRAADNGVAVLGTPFGGVTVLDELLDGRGRATKGIDGQSLDLSPRASDPSIAAVSGLKRPKECTVPDKDLEAFEVLIVDLWLVVRAELAVLHLLRVGAIAIFATTGCLWGVSLCSEVIIRADRIGLVGKPLDHGFEKIIASLDTDCADQQRRDTVPLAANEVERDEVVDGKK